MLVNNITQASYSPEYIAPTQQENTMWKIRCVALWTLLRVELMCFSLCNDSKTRKFGPSEFIQYSGGLSGI